MTSENVENAGILNHWKIQFIFYDLFKQRQIIWDTATIEYLTKQRRRRE